VTVPTYLISDYATPPLLLLSLCCPTKHDSPSVPTLQVPAFACSQQSSAGRASKGAEVKAGRIDSIGRGNWFLRQEREGGLGWGGNLPRRQPSNTERHRHELQEITPKCRMVVVSSWSHDAIIYWLMHVLRQSSGGRSEE
jgi:hypothetical protein